MSITVSFTSDSKRENSTKQLTMSATHDCTFKNGCSMLNPTLLLELETNTFPTYTAFKIENRYYKIINIVSIRNNLFEITGQIDVLATYKSNILSSTLYVCYSSTAGDPWLADTRIPVLKNTIASKAITGLPFINRDGFYVLSVVGGDTGVGGCEIFAVNKSTLNALIQDISTWSVDEITQIMRGVTITPPSYNPPQIYIPGNTATTGECFADLISSLKNMIDSLGSVAKSVQDSANSLNQKITEASTTTGFLGNAYANAPQCIRSCIWVPFDLGSFSGSTGRIYLGKYDTGHGGFKVNAKPTSSSVSVSIPWHFSDWRRGYCEDVYLYLPFVGMVAYSSASLTHASSITVNYSVTATDGNVCYEVKSGNEILGTYGGNCATNFPIGISQQASAGETFTALVGGVQKTLAAIVDSSISPLSAAGSIGKMGVEIAMAAYDVKNVTESTHFSCIGGIGGGAGVGLDLDITCYTVAHDTIINPSDMKDTMGLPTMKPMSLSALTGYCQCANGHVDAPATETELALLDTYINSGFYIE